MTIHSLYVFSRRGTCLYYKEWNRPRSTLADTPSEDRKLMFGLYFSLKQLAQKMSPAPCVISRRPCSPFRLARLDSIPIMCVCAYAVVVCSDAPGGLKRVLSSSYAIHSYESPTGYKLLLTTSREVPDLRTTLAKMYTDLFLSYVILNPLYPMGAEITCPLFVAAVDAFVRTLPSF